MAEETRPTDWWLLDGDHQRLIERLNSEAQQALVVKHLRSSLEEHADALVDTYTDYLKDEYILVLEDIAKERAKRLVNELLKGNREVAQAFRLTSTTDLQGKEVSYDFDGVRRAIFDQFKDEILNAEVVGLRKDNDSLRSQVESLTESLRHRY